VSFTEVAISASLIHRVGFMVHKVTMGPVPTPSNSVSPFQVSFHHCATLVWYINPLTPNDPYRGRTAPLTSKRCILYIYSTNIGTEYFKHGINSPFFSLQNAIFFIILTYLVPVLLAFYIQSVLKLKQKILAPKG